jgi:hypothetical protein
MKCTLAEWQTKFKPVRDFIVQASRKDGSDEWQPFPIGMQYAYALNFHKGESIQIGEHTNTVFCAISPTTDIRRRPVGCPNRALFLENLRCNSISNGRVYHNTYFDILPTFKFIVSPEGNGIDCHRHYEALMAGCIPIIEYNPKIEEKYKGCPILYTRDYSEITEQYLLEKYESMLHTTYDFSCLFMSHYDVETQLTIRDCGNYWMKKTVRCLWYPEE